MDINTLIWKTVLITIPGLNSNIDTGKWLTQNHDLFKAGTVIFGVMFFALLIWEIINSSKSRKANSPLISFDEINIVQDKEDEIEEEDPIKALMRSQASGQIDSDDELPAFLTNSIEKSTTSAKSDGPPSGLLFKDKEADYSDPFKKLLKKTDHEDINFQKNWEYEEDGTLPARLSIPQSTPSPPTQQKKVDEDEHFKALLRNSKKESENIEENQNDITSLCEKFESNEGRAGSFAADTTEMPAVHETSPEVSVEKTPLKLSIQIPEKVKNHFSENLLLNNNLTPEQNETARNDNPDEEQNTEENTPSQEIPVDETDRKLLQLSLSDGRQKTTGKKRLVELELSPRINSEKEVKINKPLNLSLNIKKPEQS
jgi:hypothetical protein